MGTGFLLGIMKVVLDRGGSCTTLWVYKVPLFTLKWLILGNSLAVHWLGFRTFTAEGAGSIPGRGTKTPQAARSGQIDK